MYRGCTAARITALFHGKPRDIERQLKDPVFILPLPLNLWPTQTYDSAMGGTVSHALGSRGHRGLRDVGFLAADDRPNDRVETNRKSHQPAARNFLTLMNLSASTQSQA